MSEICKAIKDKLMSIYNKLFVVKFRVVVLGSEGSGKSAIVSSMLGDNLKYIGKQRDAEMYEYNFDNTNYIIYDVSGKRASRTKWDYFYRRCDVLLYCVDSSSDEKRWKRSREELKSMLYRNVWTKKNMLVLGTKNDRRNAVGCKNIILNLDLMSITDREISCFSVSADNNVNISCIKPWLIDQRKFLKDKPRFK